MLYLSVFRLAVLYACNISAIKHILQNFLTYRATIFNTIMQPNIHPDYKPVKVTCSCGNEFVTASTLGRDTLHIEVCSSCHPFFTGRQKIVDTAGRVDKFRKKYAR